MAESEATLRARVAAATRWAREPDRTAATAAARAGLIAKWEREVDPDRVLSHDERQRRVASARKAHYARMALARRANKVRRAA